MPTQQPPQPPPPSDPPTPAQPPTPASAPAAVLPIRPTPQNLTCSTCGSEWWSARGIVVDAANRRVTGYTLPLTCTSCGFPCGSPNEITTTTNLRVLTGDGTPTTEPGHTPLRRRAVDAGARAIYLAQRADGHTARAVVEKRWEALAAAGGASHEDYLADAAAVLDALAALLGADLSADDDAAAEAPMAPGSWHEGHDIGSRAAVRGLVAALRAEAPERRGT